MSSPSSGPARTPASTEDSGESETPAEREDSLSPFIHGLLELRSEGSDQHQPVAARIGRYTLLRKLGEGGMGIVYACYDEQLDRKLAVKLLRSRYQGERSRVRMMREAQGLARLSHPNVVPIYEVGEHKGALFLAMEFVTGHTLGEWLEQRTNEERGHGSAPSGWRERLTTLMQAGRGLAAAHAAGLVHRDFKPDNLIVGDDGRVRVLDFGLVSAGRLEPVAAPREQPPPVSGALARELTLTGSILGTPAYMAPEQLRGEATDASADQFAFCVVAFEALYGRRPYETRALAQADTLEPWSPADRTAIPPRVHRALLRGLALAPDARWPALEDLLDELEAASERAPRVWRRVLVGATLAAALGLGLGLALADDPVATVSPCQIDASALGSTWTAERRASFSASDSPWSRSPHSARRVLVTFDAWTEAWLAGQREACEATHVAGIQSEALLDARRACLERKRLEAGALVELLERGEPEIIARSVELLARLPSIEPCTASDRELVESRYPLPTLQPQRSTILSGFERASRARSLAQLGRLREAEALRDTLHEQLGDGDYLPLELELRALDGRLSFARREFEPAIESLLEVARAAEVARHDELVASVRVELARGAAGVWGQPERERELLAEAEAAIGRLARPDDPRRCQLSIVRSRLDSQAGELESGLEHARAALECAEQPESLGTAAYARQLVGQQLADLGRFEQARAHFERALETTAALYGPRSPYLADLEHDLGLLATQTGAFEQARAHLERARPIYIEVFGEPSEEAGQIDYASAHLALQQGQLERAASLFDATLASWRDDPHVAPDRLASAHEAQGVVRYFLGHYAASLDSYGEALAIRERVLGPEHPLVAMTHSNIGESQAALGNHQAALAAYALALELFAHNLPADHPDLALPYKARGKSRLALGQVEEGIADLERALAIHAKHPGEPGERAEVEAALAGARALLDQR